MQNKLFYTYFVVIEILYIYPEYWYEIDYLGLVMCFTV